MGNYHNRIMNIQATRVKELRPQHISYKEGHRDARHAAAEIVIEAEREIEELQLKLRSISKKLFEIPLSVGDDVNKTLEDIDDILFR